MKNRRRKLLLHLYIVNKILWLSALFLSKASINTPLHSCCSAQQHVQTDTYLNITPGIRLVKSNDVDFFCTKHLTVDAARLAGSGLCHLGRLPGNPCVLRTHASTTLSQSFARPGESRKEIRSGWKLRSFTLGFDIANTLMSYLISQSNVITSVTDRGQAAAPQSTFFFFFVLFSWCK